MAVLWRRAELGVAGAAVSGVLLGAFGTVGPVYGYEMGLDVDEIATFMGLSILAAMAAALFVALYAQRSAAHLDGGVAAFYALASCIYPLCLALTHDMLSKQQIVPASATLLLANGVAPVSTSAILDLDPRQGDGGVRGSSGRSALPGP